MEKMHGNTHVFVLSCNFERVSTKTCVSMYLLHLELTFTPHYIITDKGLLKSVSTGWRLKGFNYLVVNSCGFTPYP